MTLTPGQRARIHRHAVQEEAYLVLEGTLTVIVEGEEYELVPFDALRVAPALRRQLVNRGSVRVLLIALGGSGEHAGRDAEAFGSWDDPGGRPPADVPLPPDLNL
jgi:mannose-6-phosphate isomerase-like protein (cupin superfamily)